MIKQEKLKIETTCFNKKFEPWLCVVNKVNNIEETLENLNIKSSKTLDSFVLSNNLLYYYLLQE